MNMWWLNPNFKYFVWICSYTSIIWNAFSFHKLPNIRFLEHFLQVTHKLRKINTQNNISAEKNAKVRLSRRTVSSNEVCWQDYNTTY